MNEPSFPYGTKVIYTNGDGSTVEIVAEPARNCVCIGCVFNQTGRCQQAPECGYLIWKEVAQ